MTTNLWFLPGPSCSELCSRGYQQAGNSTDFMDWQWYKTNVESQRSLKLGFEFGKVAGKVALLLFNTWKCDSYSAVFVFRLQASSIRHPQIMQIPLSQVLKEISLQMSRRHWQPLYNINLESTDNSANEQLCLPTIFLSSIGVLPAFFWHIHLIPFEVLE